MEEGSVEEKQLLELLNAMDSFTPLIPPALLNHYLMKAGVECDDHRLKNLMALVGQKFITEVVTDAMHYHRLRQNAPVKQPTPQQANTGQKKKGPVPAGASVSLSVEDLQAALADRGISLKRPPYYT